MTLASGEAMKTTTAGKQTPARGRPRGNGNDEDNCDKAENRRQRRPGGKDKAVDASPPATTTFDDRIGLIEGDDDDGYGGDCVIPAQRCGDDYLLKGGGPPADPSGSVVTSF